MFVEILFLAKFYVAFKGQRHFASDTEDTPIFNTYDIGRALVSNLIC